MYNTSSKIKSLFISNPHPPIIKKFKAIALGDASVGKSSIITTDTGRRATTYQTPTIGVDFYSRTYNLSESKTGRLGLWDTSGQERFKAIVRTFYRNSHIVLFAFDLTNFGTFNHLDYWMDEFNIYSNNNTPIVKVLVGTKLDLIYNSHGGKSHTREIHRDVALKYAKQHNMLYFETSSLDDKFYFIPNLDIENITSETGQVENICAVPDEFMTNIGDKCKPKPLSKEEWYHKLILHTDRVDEHNLNVQNFHSSINLSNYVSENNHCCHIS